MTSAIAIRDQTKDALQALVKMVDEEQSEVKESRHFVDVSLSDVIDGLLVVTRESSIEDELLREIIHIARKN